MSSRPQWRIITDAIECYFREQAEAERGLVEDLVGRLRSRAQRALRGR